MVCRCLGEWTHMNFQGTQNVCFVYLCAEVDFEWHCDQDCFHLVGTQLVCVIMVMLGSSDGSIYWQLGQFFSYNLKNISLIVEVYWHSFIYKHVKTLSPAYREREKYLCVCVAYSRPCQIVSMITVFCWSLHKWRKHYNKCQFQVFALFTIYTNHLILLHSDVE